MTVEAKTICRSEMGDDAYITELEMILEDMSTQTESMFDAISLSIAALRQIHAEYQTRVPSEDTAREMFVVADMALALLSGDPEPDEGIH